MSEETNNQPVDDAPKEVAVEKTPPVDSKPEPAPDPYSGLSDEDREAQSQFDNVVKLLSPQERLAVLQAALGEAPKADAAKVKPSEPQESEIDKLRRENAETRRMLLQRNAQDNAAAEEKLFYKTIKDGVGSDEALKTIEGAYEDVEDMVLASLVRHHKKHGGKLRFDTAAATEKAVKRQIKRMQDMSTDERRQWVRDKVESTATKTETRGSAAPGKK